ncbi:hypothetical protein M9458_045079, partial [Cirrhinus mrigala]
MLVRNVSELCPPCSDVMLTCAKNSGDSEAAVSDCAVGRSSSPPTLLTKSTMGNAWMTTQLKAH